MEINVGDVVTMQWTAPDLEPGTVASTTIKVTQIQIDPIMVLFGEQQ